MQPDVSPDLKGQVFTVAVESKLKSTTSAHVHMAPSLTCHDCYQYLLSNCDTKREMKADTYPPSKILIRTGSPLLVTRASSSDFPLLSSSFSALVISFRPSLERSEGK